jgi:molybdopterin converting factor subunit 1
MKIHVEYFAALRESAGRSAEELETAPTTALQLYESLALRYGFALQPAQIKVAINAAFAPFDTPLQPGDTVVFIPPIAGG